MNQLRIGELGALAILGAALTLACSGDASLGSNAFKQDTKKDGSSDASASSGSGDGAVTSSDGAPSGTSGDTESAASSDAGSGTTTGGDPSGSGGSASGSGSGGAASGGTTTTDGATTTDGGSGGTGNVAGTGGNASSSTDGGSNCEEVACRPYECVEYCGGPILSSDCCPCAEGLIDSFVECPKACTEGDTMDDGCNTCSCSGGAWVCTTRACPEVTYCGAMAGDTCGPDEYCAYVEGEYCGAADAQSTCQPRPEGCITLYDPVCGCDGKTYGNSCEAAAAGTGVNTSGPCEGP